MWLGVLGAVLSGALYLSPLPFALSGDAKTSLPYLNNFCIAILWTAYGWQELDFYILIPSVVGIVAGLVSMIVSGHVKAWFAIPIACSCILFGLSFVIFDIFKWILLVVGVFLVAAPVYDIFVAYKASEAIKTSALFLLVATANAIVWLIYGIVNDLIILIAVNGTGLAFIIVESIVIVVYNGQIQGYRQIQV